MEKPSREQITDWFNGLQERICLELEKADARGRFKEHRWDRPGGGGGKTRILEKGKIIEKGGVNFSAVYGELSPSIRKALDLPEGNFYASGVSIVLHPRNPMVPIIHMNVRYFEIQGHQKWFGGGIDLTPHYVNREDARFFHQTLKEVCGKHHPSYYPEFKKWADDYFFIAHRNETRGVGGVFFDRLSETPEFTLQDRFEFVKSVGEAFSPLYTHFMKKNGYLPYTSQEKKWQYVRRGRYVEFNLVYDKGTRFGFETQGRTESILMSLPPQAKWVYDYTPRTGSREEETIQLLKKGIDWTNIGA